LINGITLFELFPDDLFVIDEVSLYEGEAKDSTYAVAGEILDGVSPFTSSF